jgi:hypothetical protein
MLSFIKLTVGAALLAAVNAQFRVETPVSHPQVFVWPMLIVAS